jgi:hypothetical protein
MDDLPARQVIGQWAPAGRLLSHGALALLIRRRGGRLDSYRPADGFALQLVEHQLQLLDDAVDLLRGAPELLTAQARDLDLQLLDLERLGDQTGFRRGKLGFPRGARLTLGDQHPTQLVDIVGKGTGIDRHEPNRSKGGSRDQLLRPARVNQPHSSGDFGAPGPDRHPPIDPFKQHAELRRRQSRHPVGRRRPNEPPFLQTRGEQTHPLRVPIQRLEQITAAAPEAKNVTRERVLLEHRLDLHRQPVHAFAHVGPAAGQKHLHPGR